jgi:hypothetical protein
LLSSTKLHVLIYDYILIGNFYNKAHHDNDGSLTTFRIWVLVDKQWNRISEARNFQEISMTGGCFCIQSHKIMIDFTAKPYAIWELI